MLDALVAGFRVLSSGEVQAPARPAITVPGKGFSLTMPAWIDGMNIMVKVVNVFEGNLAVSSVGYAPPIGEMPVDLVRQAALYVETRDAFKAPPVGCAELAGLDPEAGIELGELLIGRQPGRVSDSQITVYKAMGIAMEDMVAAHLVYEKAKARDTGHRLTI